MAFEQNDLPTGWILAPVGSIAGLINGRAFKPEDWSTEGLPIVRIQNLNDHSKPFNHCNFEVDEKFVIDNGQLLFAWSGTPGTSFGCFIWNGGKAILNQHIFRVQINEKYLNKQFIRYAVNQNLDKYIQKAHGGVGLRHITKGKFEEESIPIPPLNEQHRIVSKLESIFSRIDACRGELERLASQTRSSAGSLNALRGSVLKQAFEGRLVPQNPNDEPAELLLKRINKDSDKKLVFEKENLPDGWIRTKIESVSTVILGQSPTSSTYNKERKGLPFFQGKADFGDLYPTARVWCDAPKKLAEKGNILVSVRAPVGSVNLSKEVCCIGRGLSAIRPLHGIESMYVFYQLQFLESHMSQQGTGTTFKAITGKQLRSILLNLAPLSEQRRIVSRLESIFSGIDAKMKSAMLEILPNCFIHAIH